MKKLKWFAAALSMTNILLLPAAQAAQAKSKADVVREYLKVTGFVGTEKLTVGQFYGKVRSWYPKHMQRELDIWATLHYNEPMPKVDTSIIKDNEGVEQVRIVLSKDGQTLNLTTGDEFVKVNGVKVTPSDYYDTKGLINRLIKNDKQIAKGIAQAPVESYKKTRFNFSHEQMKRMNKKQLAAFMVKYRQLYEDSVKVIETFQKSKKVSSHRQPASIFASYLAKNQKVRAADLPSDDGGDGEGVETIMPSGDELEKMDKPAPAAPAKRSGNVQSGSRCIVAGFISTYGENKSCGGVTSGREDFIQKITAVYEKNFHTRPDCQSGYYPCNPLVYGFSSGGKSICVSGVKSDIIEATKNKCGQASPLNGPEDKRRIAQSWAEAMGKGKLKFNADGTISAESYALIKDNLEDLKGLVNDAKALCDSEEGQKLQKARPDQVSACEHLVTRAFDFEMGCVAPTEPIPEPPLPAENCDDKIFGSIWDEDQKACICPADREMKTEKGKPACLIVNDGPTDPPLPPEKEKHKKGGFWGSAGSWLLGLGIIGGLGVGLYFLFHKKSKGTPPVYIPPVPPPFPPPPPPPPVTPPPPPTGTTSGEGGSGSSGTTGGGVR